MITAAFPHHCHCCARGLDGWWRTLKITQKQFTGHFDLQLESPNKKEVLFRWSEALGRYQPAR